jgi:cytochrome bd-type quinol oxidase subunit 1
VFFAFRAMVGIGVIIIAAGWVGLWLWWRQKLFDVTCHGRRGTAESDPDSDTRAQVISPISWALQWRVSSKNFSRSSP